MRILVAGATGYVGSRLVPELLRRGHEVVASSSSAPAPEAFAWGHDVEWEQCDVTDPDQVVRATRGVDAVCYLVHSLAIRAFTERDRLGAVNTRAAVERNGVPRLVYLSGLVPDVPRERLSAHIASRLEVEEILTAGPTSSLALRAGVVIGAGSTSFEVIRQLSSLLLVQPIPTWMRSRVQPVAVSDVVRYLADALEDPSVVGNLDVGGPDVLAYPALLALYCDVAGLRRARVPAIGVPPPVVGLASALLCTAPFWTVAALVDSLRHDMVCRPGAGGRLPEPEPGPLSARVAMERALGLAGPDVAEALTASDAAWVGQRRGLLSALPVPAVVRSGAHLVERRVTGVLLGALRG